MTLELISLLSFVFLFGLCWGSFLNVVAYRLTFDKPFFTKRSHCPHCNHMIAWYDNIPLISWFLLHGKCRTCKKPISIIYPIFELLTATIMLFLFIKFLPRFFPIYYLLGGDPLPLSMLNLDSLIPAGLFIKAAGVVLAGGLFLSALIVSSIADLRAMVIPQMFTVWLVPIGIVLSYFGLTSISWQMSMLGSILGYGSLWLVAKLFKVLTKKDGLGIGDMELLCMIGAFSGPFGVWISLMLGSILGMVIGGLYLWLSGHGRMTRIPFGPFLATGALAYFFFGQQILRFLN